MSKRFRNAAFAVLFLMFLVIGGGVVFYAQGWRADFETLTVNKVGGIYLRTYPDTATITLDGEELERNAGLFERGVLAGSLFPKEYRVEVLQEGYKVWAAKLPVLPRVVTSHPAIVLVPLLSRDVSTSTVVDFQTIGEAILLETASGTIVHDGRTLASGTIVGATSDARVIITKSKSGAFSVTGTETATSTLMARAFPRLGLDTRASSTRIMNVPENPALLLFMTSSTLRLANLTTGTPTPLEGGGVSAAAASGSRIAWTNFDPLRKASILSFYDLPAASFVRGADVIPGRTLSITFSGRDGLLLLQEDGSLYSLSAGSGNRVKIGSTVSRFAIDRDGTLAFVDEKGVNIVAGGGSGRAYTFLSLPDPKQVRRLAWYKDGEHLFIGYPNKVVFLDLHDHSLQNVTEIAATEKFEYVPETNEFYYLENNALKTLRFPD